MTPTGHLRADAERNVRAIIDAAIVLLAAEPDASMERVATAAGVGRATVYRHFASRDHLVRAILDRALQDARDAVVGSEPARGTAPEALGRAVEALLKVADRYRLVRSVAPHDAELRRRAEEVGAPLTAIIQRGQKEGTFRKDLTARWGAGALGALLQARHDPADRRRGPRPRRVAAGADDPGRRHRGALTDAWRSRHEGGRGRARAELPAREGEKRTLRWIAARLPRWVLPDDLTALGVLAAIAICVAYQLSNDSLGWLWVASGLLVVQWFGDSLDGTLARVRGIERPTLRLLPRPPRRRDRDRAPSASASGSRRHAARRSAPLIVVAYLILSINVYLESYALGRFSIGYGLIGPDRDAADHHRAQRGAGDLGRVGVRSVRPGP